MTVWSKTHTQPRRKSWKWLYHVYFKMALSEFKRSCLHWNRVCVIIIASSPPDSTLKWSCHFVYSETTVCIYSQTHMCPNTQTLLGTANPTTEPGRVGRMTSFYSSCPKRSEQTDRKWISKMISKYEVKFTPKCLWEYLDSIHTCLCIGEQGGAPGSDIALGSYAFICNIYVLCCL